MNSPFTSELQVTGSQEVRLNYITEGLNALKVELIKLGGTHNEVTTVDGTHPEGMDGLLFDAQVLVHELVALADSVPAKTEETPAEPEKTE